MEYYNGIYCVSARELIDGGIMTKSNYSVLAKRGRIDVVRQGGGLGRYALVAVDSLPKRFLDKINFDVISPFAAWIKSNYQLNQRAIAFYMDYSMCGKRIKCTEAIKLAVNASLMDALLKIKSSPRISDTLFGGKISWDIVCEFLKTNRTIYGHTLPISPIRLKNKLRTYQQYGLSSLISGRFGNQNARKVN